jgi:hypothetical protein
MSFLLDEPSCRWASHPPHLPRKLDCFKAGEDGAVQVVYSDILIFRLITVEAIHEAIHMESSLAPTPRV